MMDIESKQRVMSALEVAAIDLGVMGEYISLQLALCIVRDADLLKPVVTCGVSDCEFIRWIQDADIGVCKDADLWCDRISISSEPM